jgi:hypothetical protein
MTGCVLLGGTEKNNGHQHLVPEIFFPVLDASGRASMADD